MGAALVRGFGDGGRVRVLDLGAGVGALAVAASAAFRDRGIECDVVAVESDPETADLLGRTLGNVGQTWPAVTYRVVRDNAFRLADPELGEAPIGHFDAVISNPPYFKMSPSAPEGGRAPNAYARFMNVGLRLLRQGGRLCFIVPRSFASGFYYRRFRKELLSSAGFESIHVFESRSDQFDEVLQENVIVVLRKGPPLTPIEVTSSAGIADLGNARRTAVPADALVRPTDGQSVIRIPTSPAELETLKHVDSLPYRLRDFGLEISTGPVVPFRAKDRLLASEGTTTVPLLWMQHVLAGRTVWPLSACKKPQFLDSADADKLLIPAGNYVLLRRFSAKEERRRLIAAPVLRGQIPTAQFAIENHVNYIHRGRGSMMESEAIALSELLNSDVYDRYFRIMNGNTQVSATEIRSLPLPDLARLRRAETRPETAAAPGP